MAGLGWEWGGQLHLGRRSRGVLAGWPLCNCLWQPSPKLHLGSSQAVVLYRGPGSWVGAGSAPRGLGGAGRLAGPAPVLCPGLVCKEAGAQGGGGLWGHDRRLDPGPLCLVTAAHGLCRVSASSSEKWVKAAQAVGGQGGDEWAS